MLITHVGLGGSLHLVSARSSAIVDPAQYRGRHTLSTFNEIAKAHDLRPPDGKVGFGT
jgi:hypothetical protein